MDRPRAVTAADIRRGLERTYREGWIVLHEVSNHLGWMPRADNVKHEQSKRYLDTVAVGLYRRTGYAIRGHEIKVSRADWLAELRKPNKAAAFSALVTEFYVVSPPGVVHDGELPPLWGHLLWYPHCIKQSVSAHNCPIPLSPWIASLLARCNNPVKTES